MCWAFRLLSLVLHYFISLCTNTTNLLLRVPLMCGVALARRFSSSPPLARSVHNALSLSLHTFYVQVKRDLAA
jgi:hypothetical protein